MPRTSNSVASRRRKKRLFQAAEGNVGGRRRLYRTAKETVRRAMRYSFRDRRDRKGMFRAIWITRLSGALQAFDMSYSRFINGLNVAGFAINRKTLSELAIHDPEAFANIVTLAKNNCGK